MVVPFLALKEMLCGRIRKNFEKRLLASSCFFHRSSEWNNWAPTGQVFFEFDTFSILSKVRWENSGLIKICHITVLVLKTCAHLWSYLAQFLSWRPVHIYDRISPSSCHEDLFTFMIYLAQFLSWRPVHIYDRISPSSCHEDLFTFMIVSRPVLVMKTCAHLWSYLAQFFL